MGSFRFLLLFLLGVVLPLPAIGAVAGSIGASGAVMDTTRGDRYVTPRENLTKVANAIRLSTYSLSTHVTVPGGLALTQQVRVTVRFNSYSGSAYSDVVVQMYDNINGNRLILNDQEGLGTPRQANLQIELFEYPVGWTGGRVE